MTSTPKIEFEPLTPPSYSPDRLPTITKSVWEHQCIPRELLSGDMPDGTLAAWRADGWELVQTVKKGAHEFLYLRRLRADNVGDRLADGPR